MPSREVFEAIERRQKDGLCEVCGAKLKTKTLKGGKFRAYKYCPDAKPNDGRHAQPGFLVAKDAK